MQTSSDPIHKKLLQKLNDNNLIAEERKIKSEMEGVDKVLRDKKFGFLIEGGKEKGIFSKRLVDDISYQT